MRVEVLALMPDGRPARVAFHFDRSVDSPTLVWTRWEGTGFVPFGPPKPGDTVAVPAVDYLRALGVKS